MFYLPFYPSDGNSTLNLGDLQVVTQLCRSLSQQQAEGMGGSGLGNSHQAMETLQKHGSLQKLLQ